MRVRFWGARGSLATPGPTTLRYGGNTSCIELRTAADTLLVFDCGTGARQLGIELLRQSPDGVSGSILLSHTHWDHIQGFPFFAPIFHPGSNITIYGPTEGQKSIETVLAGQMEFTYFPINLDQLQARIEFRSVGEDTFAVAEATIRTQYLNHTALALAYRVEVGGLTVIYATDHEPNASRLWRADPTGRRRLIHPSDLRHVEFLAGADLLIHDAQYTAEEYAEKVNWGHSPMEYVVDVAAEAGVKRLALHHHDPSHTDRQLDRLVAHCQRRAEAGGADLAVFGAREGHELSLSEVGSALEAGQTPTTPLLDYRPRVLIAEDDPDVRAVLADSLAEDGYELLVARDGREALGLALGQPPDLALLDVHMPELSGFEVCRELRGEPRTESTPVILITASPSESDVVEGFEEGATDYLTKPFAPSMVRARVRSWLLRGQNHRG